MIDWSRPLQFRNSPACTEVTFVGRMPNGDVAVSYKSGGDLHLLRVRADGTELYPSEKGIPGYCDIINSPERVTRWFRIGKRADGGVKQTYIMDNFGFATKEDALRDYRDNSATSPNFIGVISVDEEVQP